MGGRQVWSELAVDAGDRAGRYNRKDCAVAFLHRSRGGKAEEALRHYTSIFKGSDIEGFLYYGEESEYPKGYVKHAQFKLEGQTFMAMDSGVENDFPFNEAISFIINCKDQEEIDYYWSRLTDGGDPKAQQCGWLKDKFGVSWQVIPEYLDSIFNNGNREKANRGMVALLSMKKIDLEVLTKACKEA